MSTQNGHYYISSGNLNCFYTLRYTFTEACRVGDDVGTIERDYYICNLSTDPVEATRKAKERTGCDLDASHAVDQIHRRTNIDWSILQAGGRTGQSIFTLLEDKSPKGGRDYLLWLCENCATSKNYAKTVELAKAYLEHELTQRADDRQAKKDEATAKAEAYALRCKPVSEIIKAQKGDFCASIACDIENGIAPRGRAFSIVCDIYGKAFGRRNSKAYNTAYGAAQELLEVAE